MKNLTLFLLASLLALSSFSQTQGTAIRATNGVAFGTLTVQGNINATNTGVTNKLSGRVEIGKDNVASSLGAVAYGQNNRVASQNSIAGGSNNTNFGLNSLSIGLLNSVQSSAPNSITSGNRNSASGANVYVGGESNISNGRSTFLHGKSITMNGGLAGTDNDFISGRDYVVDDGCSNTWIWSGSAMPLVDGTYSDSFFVHATNKIYFTGAPVTSVSGFIGPFYGSNLVGSYVGVAGTTPYTVSNLWSVVLPDGATAFQLGNPGAGYASIFATNLIITPDGLHYTLFTDGTNSFFGGDLYLTNSTFHGKSFRPTKVAMTVVGATAQSTNLMEIQDGSSNVLASVTASGVFTGNGAGLTNIAGSSVSGSGAGLTNITDISTNMTAGGDRFFRTWGDPLGGFQSVYIGPYAGNPTPLLTNRNFAMGNAAGLNFTTNTYDNTVVGDHGLPVLVSGNRNSGIGLHVMGLLTNGNYNSAGPGVGVLEHLQLGDGNTAAGMYAGVWLNNSTNNSFFGSFSGSAGNGADATGQRNSGFGAGTQYRLSNGWANTTLGDSSGQYIVSGSSNVFIGVEAGNPSGQETTNAIAIGTGTSVTNSGAINIGNIIKSFNGSRVGINTPGSQSSMLDVYSTFTEPQGLFHGYSTHGGLHDYNGMIQVGVAGSTEGIVLQYDGGASGGFLDNKWAGDDTGGLYFRLKTAGTPVNALTLLATGNNGVGTTSPQDALDVAGGVRAKSLTITNSSFPSDNATTNGQTSGQIWYGGTSSNAHTFFGNLYKVNRSFVMGQSVVLADVTVTNTADATTNTVIYTIPMAANYLTVGKIIEPQLDGVCWQNNNVGTHPTLQAWINQTNLLLTVPMLASTAITAGPWQANFRFTCRAIGNSAQLMGKCLEVQSATSGGVSTSGLDSIVTPVTFDSTVNNTITITVSNRVAGGGGACSMRLQEGRTVCIDSVPKLPGEQ